MSGYRNLPIPTDLAVRLCAEIRQKHNQQWDFSSSSMVLVLFKSVA